MPHPVDAPEFAGQRALFRTASAGSAALLVVVSAGVGMVVNFTLGGVPLLGNRYRVGELPAPTLVALSLTPFVIAAAYWHGRARLAGAVAQTGRAHPELAGDAGAERERLFRAVGAGLFGTLSVLVPFGILLAVAFHLTASPGILACVGLVALAVLAGYPTGGRVRAAYDRAARLRQ